MKPKAVLAVDDIWLSGPDFWRLPREEREGAFATLRAERPMSFHKEEENAFFPTGPGYWAAVLHADICEASKNNGVWCSGQGAATIADLPAEFLDFFGSLINMDDPRHMRLRRLVSAGFTPIQLKKAGEEVEHAATKVIDAVVEKGECDFVVDIAAPFPLKIVCDIMGIPESENQFVFDRTNIILGGGDPEYVAQTEDVAAIILQAGADLSELMKDLRRQRLATPTDDVTSILAHAEIDGDRLTEEEMAAFFILMVSAGNETTRTAIAHGMKALHDNPEQREIWGNDFETVSQSAVEEVVRWASPVIFMRRTATQDTVLGGQEVKQGEKVLMFYNSGNRDEAVFENPHAFDVTRWPNDHVAYGGPGVHFCLGANLARREITVMFREIFKRLPDLEITGEPQYLYSNFINGIKHMPCRFTPGAKASAATALPFASRTR